MFLHSPLFVTDYLSDELRYKNKNFFFENFFKEIVSLCRLLSLVLHHFLINTQKDTHIKTRACVWVKNSYVYLKKIRVCVCVCETLTASLCISNVATLRVSIMLNHGGYVFCGAVLKNATECSF